MLFLRNTNKNTRQEAKRRLKLVIAHDRASLSAELVSAMREEILDVVARYVEIDRDQMEFGLENSDRITSLTANLPIRQIRLQNKPQEREKPVVDPEVEIEITEIDDNWEL